MIEHALRELLAYGSVSGIWPLPPQYLPWIPYEVRAAARPGDEFRVESGMWGREWFVNDALVGPPSYQREFIRRRVGEL